MLSLLLPVAVSFVEDLESTMLIRATLTALSREHTISPRGIPLALIMRSFQRNRSAHGSNEAGTCGKMLVFKCFSRAFRIL